MQNLANGDLSTEQWVALASLSKEFQTRMGLITFVTIILVLLLSAFFSHQISIPTKRVKDAINTIRDGNYKGVARVETDDEIGQLLTALNHMTEHIKVRDELKLEKIREEKARFASLANYLNVSLVLVNRENNIAFCTNEFLDAFAVGWDDIYEVPLWEAPIPAEVKKELESAIKQKEWLNQVSLDIIGENYAHELYLTLLPVKVGEQKSNSIICLLGNIISPNEAQIGSC